MQSDTLRGSVSPCRYRVKAGARTTWGADWSRGYACGGSEKRIGPPMRSFGDARRRRERAGRFGGHKTVLSGVRPATSRFAGTSNPREDLPLCQDEIPTWLAAQQSSGRSTWGRAPNLSGDLRLEQRADREVGRGELARRPPPTSRPFRPYSGPGGAVS